MTIPNSANRGVHTANFRVLRLATYPAVLVECGFLSNRHEGGEARDFEYRELLADRIAEAIVEQRYGPGVYHASAEATVRSTESKVISYGYSKVSAQNNQSAAAVKGQQSIESAHNTVANAKQTKSSTRLRSAQTIEQARSSLTSQELSLQSTLASNATKTQPPKNSTVVNAANTVKTAKLTVESDKRAISETRLYAPADGTVASISKTAGEAVTGSGASSGEAGSEASAGSASGGTAGAASSGSNDEPCYGA